MCTDGCIDPRTVLELHPNDIVHRLGPEVAIFPPLDLRATHHLSAAIREDLGGRRESPWIVPSVTAAGLTQIFQ